MPNHITNEIVFEGITQEQCEGILSKIINKDGNVDFGILLPRPIHCWLGDLSSKDEATFQCNWLNWSRENWGTKWNAYGQKPAVYESGALTIIFDTAWAPPYPWLVAVLNTFKIPFKHNWLDEGESHAHCGAFTMSPSIRWDEKINDSEEYKRLHHLKWGVESFGDDE